MRLLFQNLVSLLLIITSFSFSQSGAAKSLEIGNRWDYVRHTWYDAFSKSSYRVIGDTILNSKTFARISLYNTSNDFINESFERADSSKIYQYSINYLIESIKVNFDAFEGTTCDAGYCTEIKKEMRNYLDSLRLFLYHDWDDGFLSGGSYTYVYGIGMISSTYWGHGDLGEWTDPRLIYLKLDGEVLYDGYPNFEVNNLNDLCKSTVELYIKSDWITLNSNSMFEKMYYQIDDNDMIELNELPYKDNDVKISINVDSDGTHQINFKSIDVYNEERVKIIYITVDATPPLINISNSISNTIFLSNNRSSISINYQVIENNFDKIGYSINNSEWIWSDEQNSNFIFNNFSNDENLIEIKAIDLAENETTKLFNVIVDNVPPILTILTPQDSLTYQNASDEFVKIDYYVIENYFNKIGYSVNNGEWVWSEEWQSTLNIEVKNNDDYIQIKAIDLAGNESEIYEINVEKIANFKLTQNYPNPFNPTTQISYELPQDSDVELIIYNSLGEEVNTLVNNSQSVGRYTINWNGLNSKGEQVPGGIYFYTLKTDDFTQTKKMLLLR